jgi:hypothetical protein
MQYCGPEENCFVFASVTSYNLLSKKPSNRSALSVSTKDSYNVVQVCGKNVY